MRCPNCGREIAAGAAICGYCSVVLPRSVPRQRTGRSGRSYGPGDPRVPNAYFSSEELYEDYTLTQPGAYYGNGPTEMRSPKRSVRTGRGADGSRTLQEIIIVLLALHVVLDLLLIIQGIFA